MHNSWPEVSAAQLPSQGYCFYRANANYLWTLHSAEIKRLLLQHLTTLCLMSLQRGFVALARACDESRIVRVRVIPLDDLIEDSSTSSVVHFCREMCSLDSAGDHSFN